MRGKSKAPPTSHSAPAENGTRHAATPQVCLAMLGERVRDARARHGTARKMLARDAKISERYQGDRRIVDSGGSEALGER